MRKFLAFCSFLLVASAPCLADKIIMKDGKIYEGRILGETTRSIMFVHSNFDPKPKVLKMEEILTIVREKNAEDEVLADDGKFASATLGLAGQTFSSSEFSFSPAPALTAGGAFRIFPVIEVGGEILWAPSLRHGSLSVANSQTGEVRGYEDFYSLDGGFSVKIFPFYMKKHWRGEPYLTTGYMWSRLVPKDSGDSMSGSSIFGGAGLLYPWWKPLYWDFRMLYRHTNFDKIRFLSQEGSLSGVTLNAFMFSVGLSWRFQ